MRTILVLLYLVSSNAVYIPLQDTQLSYPLLCDASSGAVLKWSVGHMARLRLTSSAMRVSSRGVRFFPAIMELRPLTDWSQTVCTAEENMLCKTSGGSSVFPETADTVLIPQAASLIGDSFTAPMGLQPCSRYSARLVADINTYTVSLCDITQKGSDLILKNGVLHYLNTEERLWYYLTLGAFTVILVTSVAQNIAHLLGETKTVTNIWLELLCVIASVALCLFTGPIKYTGVWTSYVSVGDRVVFLCLIVYISYRILYWVLVHVKKNESKVVPVNIILATLLLSLCSLYDGMENNYVAPVLFMLLTRAFFKAEGIFLSPVYTQTAGDKIEEDDILFIPSLTWEDTVQNRVLYTATQVAVITDFALAAITHQYGFRSQFEQPHMGDAFFIMLTLFAYSLSVYLREPKTSHI